MSGAGTGGRSSRSKPPVVLIIDDVEDNREMYAMYLEHVGLQAVLASDGLEGLARARELCPDVIVLDLSMPVIDGWEAARLLRADQATKQIPVIVLTGHAIQGMTHAADCDALLTKPCLPEDLYAEIQRQLVGGGAAHR